jgi:nitroreductase/dihydropteridine reductase
VVVENPEVRAKLREAAYGQAQLTDASQIFVFAAETEVDANLVAKYIDLIADTRNTNRADLEGFEQMVAGNVATRTADENINWASKQAYIGLGVLLAAAAELQIDGCPMEGFSPAAFDEILGLKEKGLTTAVIAAVGFRSTEDVYSKLPKVRKPHSDLFIHI